MDQHFLVDLRVVDRMVEAAEVGGEDVVVDVGAGRGVIAERLAQKARMVYVVESDASLRPHLEALKARHGNVRIFIGNFITLKLPWYNKVVANPPFSILEPLIQRHLRNPVKMSLLTPLRFAQRLTENRDSLLKLKTSLSYDLTVVDVFDGDVFEPPYPGKAALVLFEPAERSPADRLMLEFLSQRRSKARNAIRNIFWKTRSKREATKLVELSTLDENLLNKPVKRLLYSEAKAVHEFIRKTLDEKASDTNV
ncbi:MAG: rRNA adenine N-6-methyltransferase family protein [Candidatus Caldarchaeum sp.]|nr:rRNA adenine N-6-methyltransferase family protein [Candidatus Caldarchaeum sp.]MDW8360116.1 rRNA adenine N-6-methyltransferase family protein [Candidatus Caldarchaeum sp.]